MAFPFIFDGGFETGDNSEWDSEEDTGTLLDFPSYKELARIPGLGMPYRGAHCMRIACGDTNDHTVTEGDLNIADTATAWLRLYLFIDKRFAATADDIFNIYEWQQAGGTVEAAMSLQITAATDVVEIGVGDGVAASVFPHALSKGAWHLIEASMLVSTGGAGTLELFVDRASVQSFASLTNAAAVGSGSLGTQNTLATTTGVLLFDQFVFDDLRIGPLDPRWPVDLVLTKSGHAFVGPGEIDNVTLNAAGVADCVMEIYDTDAADVLPPYRTRLTNTAGEETVDPAGVPVEALTKGAYILLSGTNPRATVKIKHAVCFGSEGAIRTYALRNG